MIVRLSSMINMGNTGELGISVGDPAKVRAQGRAEALVFVRYRQRRDSQKVRLPEELELLDTPGRSRIGRNLIDQIIAVSTTDQKEHRQEEAKKERLDGQCSCPVAHAKTLRPGL